MPTPEESAREIIDHLLAQSGWVVQDYTQFDLTESRGLVGRGVRLVQGRYDYLLLVDRNPVGAIKIRKAGTILTTEVERPGQDDGDDLAHLRALLFPAGVAKLPFIYESTGNEILFRDEREARPRAHLVSGFHRPETLARWLEEPHTSASAGTDPDIPG